MWCATSSPIRIAGPITFDRLDADRIERYHVSRLKQLGYQVVLTRSDAA